MRERVCEGMFNKLRTARLPLWIWQALPPLIRCSRSKNESVLSTLHLLICWRGLTGCRSLPSPARYRISTSHNLESHASDGLTANAESAAECLDLRLGGQCHWQLSHLALQDKQRTMTLRTLVSQGETVSLGALTAEL